MLCKAFKNTVLFGAAIPFMIANLTTANAGDIEAAPAAKPPVDIAFGVTLASQYISRGKAQSAGNPAIQGYAELRMHDWFYIGAWSSSVDFSTDLGLSDPSSEVDLYAGVRHTWGNVTMDFAYVYYWYTGEKKGYADTDYWELRAKPSIALDDFGSVGMYLVWSPDFIGNGADQTYLTVNASINLPNPTPYKELGFYTSGEFGKRWVGVDKNGFDSPDYLTWNAGIGATYKSMRLDARYWDSNLSDANCLLSAGATNWCGDRYLVTLSFDTTLSQLK